MPARPPTPPTEALGRYFTVHKPYPQYPNMELLAHRKELAFWISNILGNSMDLISMYHKPKSNMIVLEVNISADDQRRLLGEHRWAEILRHPSPEEMNKYSQIFHCRWNHYRGLQKNGWKRIDVQASWFREWKLINQEIVHPYPLSHFCELPPEPATDERMCRELPVEYWPRPKPKQLELSTAPPGSQAWLDEKKNGKVSKVTLEKGLEAAKAPAKNTHRPPVTPPGLARLPASSSTGAGTNPWIRQQSTASSASSAIYAPSPVYAPSLPRLNITTPPTAGPSEPIKPAWTPTPGLSPDASVNGRGSSDGGSARMTPCTPYDGPDFEQAMDGLSVEDNDDWGLWDAGLGPAPSQSSVYVQDVRNEGEPQESLWADYGNEEEEVIDPNVVICEVHGILCKKGICKQLAKQLKAIEKAKKDAERAKSNPSKADQQSTWRTQGKKSYSRVDKVIYNDGTNSSARIKPAHLLNPSATASTTSEDSAPSSPAPAAVPTQTKPAPRQKPAHLANPTAAPSADPNAPRPIRTRRTMNAAKNTSTPPTPAAPASDSALTTEPSPSADPTGWGYIPRGPFGPSVGAPSIAKSVAQDAKSVAASSTGGWGHPPPTPWDSVGTAGVSATAKNGQKAAGGGRKPADGSFKKASGASKSGGGSKNAGKRTKTKVADEPKTKVDDKGPKKSWADQMEDEDADDSRSVGESTNGGWGPIPTTPWG